MTSLLGRWCGRTPQTSYAAQVPEVDVTRTRNGCIRDELDALPWSFLPTPSGSQGRGEFVVGPLDGLAERTVGDGPLADFPLVDRAVERAHHPGLDLAPPLDIRWLAAVAEITSRGPDPNRQSLQKKRSKADRKIG